MTVGDLLDELSNYTTTLARRAGMDGLIKELKRYPRDATLRLTTNGERRDVSLEIEPGKEGRPHEG